MKQNKILIAVALILVVAGIYWYTQKKKTELPTEGPADLFAQKDQMYYDKAVALFKELDPGGYPWVAKAVKEAYDSGAEKYLVGKRKSKVKSFVLKLGEVAANKDGKFTDKFGVKTLWPQSFFDKIWEESLTPFESEFYTL